MLIDHTPASCDQDHIDIVISSRASTPDRTAFIMGESKDDPFAVMEQDGFSLVHYGATVIAIPCNTAHYFYDRLAEALPVPVLNMPRLTVADAKAAGCTKLGILATDGTLQAETYQIACRDAGIYRKSIRRQRGYPRSSTTTSSRAAAPTWPSSAVLCTT